MYVVSILIIPFSSSPVQSRQSQNRQAQRAHRARRTDYVQTLEERLKQYEADEIHSNVRLQEVSRALKGDNERLKKELAALKAGTEERSRWDDENQSLDETVDKLRSEVNDLRAQMGMTRVAVEARRRSLTRPASFPVSPPVQRRPTLDCPICPDPDPDCPCQQPERRRASLDSLSLAAQTVSQQSNSCGLCQLADECLCRVVQVQPTVHEDAGCGLCTTSTFCACKEPLQSRALASPTTAMPLRLRSRPSGSRPRIWAIDNHVVSSEAICSGDPSNCKACRDDAFGSSPSHPAMMCA